MGVVYESFITNSIYAEFISEDQSEPVNFKTFPSGAR